MSEPKIKISGHLLWTNALRFVFNVGYSFIFPMFFGNENILASVALCVGLTMLPHDDLKVKPHTMAGIIAGLNLGCGLTAQFALASPWLALPINFLFAAVLLLLTSEPTLTKPSVSFLLCFVFCQAAPVPASRLPMRLLGLAVGSAITIISMLCVWKHKGYGKDGRNLVQQIRHCSKHRDFILRMSVGLAAAMFIGMILHLKKPLWISIVVMSLTQMDLKQTVERIKFRAIGTVIGVIVFTVLFGLLIPPEYSTIAILMLGYLSFFTSDYKHKTIVNAVSAINASLVLLDTGTAIGNRFACLFVGICIVVFLWFAQFMTKYLTRCIRQKHAGPVADTGRDSAAGREAEPPKACSFQAASFLETLSMEIRNGMKGNELKNASE